MSLKKEISCGCIIFKDNKVLLVYEKNCNFWGFPKGHIENNETEIETATREVKEEVGLDVEIDESKRYAITYTVKDEIEKTSVFYIAKPLNLNVKMQESEISDVKWCTYDEAVETITYDNLKELFRKVLKDL